MTDANLPERVDSRAEQQRKRMGALMDAVDQRSDMLVTLLRDTGISFDRFREVLRRAIIKGQEKPETNLLLADAGSVIQACIDACTAGLLPDGKQGAIVMYNVNVAPRGQQKQWAKRAQFLPMYEGMLAIAYASKNFQSIMAHVVYDVDEWDYELGIDPWIKHKPGNRPALRQASDGEPGEDPYKVVAAYAVAKTTTGGVFVEVFEPEDIRKVMAVSRAKSGPAKDWPEQMARKGPLRRMWKFLPRDNRMDRLLELDDDTYDQDLLVPEEKSQPSLKPGFAPKTLSAPTDEPMDLTMDLTMDRVEDGVELAAHQDDGPGEIVPDQVRHTAAVHTPPEHDEATLPSDPEDDDRPERIREYAARLDTAAAWLGIKQALRSLYKAEDWDRGEWEDSALTWAWERKVEIGDKTDFVEDCHLFACWLAGADPSPDADAVEGNMRVLVTQPDYKKASPETQDWVQRLVKGAAE